MPEDKKEAFVQEIVDEYELEIPCEADGLVHFYLDELVLQASKPCEKGMCTYSSISRK